MAKEKLPKAVYHGVGHRLVLDWIFPDTNNSLFFGPYPGEKRPKLFPLGRHAFFDGGAGLLGLNQKRKSDPIPADFRSPLPPLHFPPLDEWGLEEWRDYALLQQDLADALQDKLAVTWGDLLEAQDKLSRKKPTLKPDSERKPGADAGRGIFGGLLGSMMSKQPGRPKGAGGSSRAALIARQVIQLQDEMQRPSSKRVKNTEALKAYKEKLGWRGRENIGANDGTILTKMSEIKKSR